MKNKITSPFFVINPKSFLYGKSLLNLAKHANQLAENHKLSILFTAPPTELSNIVNECPNLIVTSQHMDDAQPGDAMGKVLSESLEYIGVQAVVLNHADNPLSISQIENSIYRAEQLKLQTIVCANSIKEAQAIALFEPDVILAEPTELIGKSEISNDEYVTTTIDSIKKINSDILVEQGAGIRTPKDVEELLSLGADGVGVTSGIVKDENPIESMKEMIEAVASFKETMK